MCEAESVGTSMEENSVSFGYGGNKVERLEDVDRLISMLAKDGVDNRRLMAHTITDEGSASNSYVNIYIIPAPATLATDGMSTEGIMGTEALDGFMVGSDGVVSEKVEVNGSEKNDPGIILSSTDNGKPIDVKMEEQNDGASLPCQAFIKKKSRESRKEYYDIFQTFLQSEAVAGTSTDEMIKTESLKKTTKTMMKKKMKERQRKNGDNAKNNHLKDDKKNKRDKKKCPENVVAEDEEEAASIVDERLLQLLPMSDTYKYRIKSVIDEEPRMILNDNDSLHSAAPTFKVSFTVNINTANEFAEWKHALQTKTHTQYNVFNTMLCEERYVDFKQYLKCHHNVIRGKLGVRKHTGCPARITVTIRSIPKRIRKNRTKVNPKSRCEISLWWNHNHPILATDILRLQSVSPETQQKLIDLFKHGHNPGSAITTLKMDIEDNIQDGESLENILASRSLCPDYQHCRYLYKKLFTDNIVLPTTSDIVEDGDGGAVLTTVKNDSARLIECIRDLNQKFGELCVVHEELEDNRSVIAMCTPFMRRVHELISDSGEIVYVDSAGGFDHRTAIPKVAGTPAPKNKWTRISYRVIVFMAHSKAGALPLVIGLTPSDTPQCLTCLFNLIKSMLPDQCYYRRGREQGPLVFMTGDTTAEQTALHAVWPTSAQYLCQYGVLQAQWQWLQQSSNGVRKDDRPELFNLVKKLMYAPNEAELSVHCELFCASPVVAKYSNFRDQISDLFENKKAAWCCAFRPTELQDIDHCSNFIDCSMRLLKDQIIQRTRAFNLSQMVHFLATRFSGYYERRLFDFAKERPMRPFARFSSTFDNLPIKEHFEDVYEVPSEKDPCSMLTVNLATTMCTCTDGTPRICQHVQYVYELKNRSNVDENYHLNEDRELMYLVACGGNLNAGLSAMLDDGISSELHDKEVELDELWKSKIAERARLNPRAFIGAYESFIGALRSISTARAAIDSLYSFASAVAGERFSAKRDRKASSDGASNHVKRKKLTVYLKPAPVVMQQQQQQVEIQEAPNYFSNVFELTDLPITFCPPQAKWI